MIGYSRGQREIRIRVGGSRAERPVIEGAGRLSITSRDPLIVSSAAAMGGPTYRCATMLQIAQVRTLSFSSSSCNSMRNLLKSCAWLGLCRPICVEIWIMTPPNKNVGSLLVLEVGNGQVHSRQSAFTTPYICFMSARALHTNRVVGPLRRLSRVASV